MGRCRDLRKQEIANLPGDQVAGAGDSNRCLVLTPLVTLRLMDVE